MRDMKKFHIVHCVHGDSKTMFGNKRNTKARSGNGKWTWNEMKIASGIRVGIISTIHLI